MIDEVLNTLMELAESKGETLYEICFRNAGVGFVWHNEKKAGPVPQEFAPYEYGSFMSAWTKAGLVAYRYYDTVSEAIAEETKRLEAKDADG